MVATFQAEIGGIHRCGCPRDFCAKLSDTSQPIIGIFSNYLRVLNIPDSDRVGDKPCCWQPRHLFNPTAKASQWDWLCLFASAFFAFFHLPMESENSVKKYECLHWPTSVRLYVKRLLGSLFQRDTRAKTCTETFHFVVLPGFFHEGWGLGTIILEEYFYCLFSL